MFGSVGSKRILHVFHQLTTWGEGLVEGGKRDLFTGVATKQNTGRPCATILLSFLSSTCRLWATPTFPSPPPPRDTSCSSTRTGIVFHRRSKQMINKSMFFPSGKTRLHYAVASTGLGVLQAFLLLGTATIDIVA